MCKIIPELDGNVSDHLSLCILFTLDVNIPIKATKIEQDETLTCHGRHMVRKNKYRDILQKKTWKCHSYWNWQAGWSQNQAKTTILSSTKLLKRLDTTRKNTFQLKAFWCPELQKLRDKNILSWQLWSTCGHSLIFALHVRTNGGLTLVLPNLNAWFLKPIYSVVNHLGTWALNVWKSQPI